jgi:hypothetical protein
VNQQLPSASQEAWFQVDSQLRSLRRHLQISDSEEQFQAVGALARETLVSLTRAIADDAENVGAEISKTHMEKILGAYLDRKIPGSSNAELRAYARSCWQLTAALVHNRNASYPLAEICTEACAHLVVLVRILFFEEVAPPNERFRHQRAASAESDFITSWIMHNLNSHPVAIDQGLAFAGLSFDGPRVTLIVHKKGERYHVSVFHPYWWKGANTLSASMLLDELLVRVLTEGVIQEFRVSGQPPA